MACLSLGFWEAIAQWIVILIAIVALLRLLIVALGGGNWWPPVSNPLTQPAPVGLLGFVAAALNIIIWAIIMLAIIWLIFSLIGCLIGAGPPFHFPVRP